MAFIHTQHTTFHQRMDTQIRLSLQFWPNTNNYSSFKTGVMGMDVLWGCSHIIHIPQATYMIYLSYN